ncbi:MAG: hypothetical protein PHI97_09865 [Desulfobulbus sp.]|nr:hypothetical protein [Desulfobulbus sp.]
MKKLSSLKISDAKNDANELFYVLRNINNISDYHKNILNKYKLDQNNPTGILYTALGVMSKIALFQQIKKRKNYYKKIKKIYIESNIKKQYKNNAIFFDEKYGVSFSNTPNIQLMYEGLMPGFKLNGGEYKHEDTQGQLAYNEFVKNNQFKLCYNGEFLYMHWHEILEYFTRLLYPLKEMPQSFTLKSLFINEELMKKTTARLYIIKLSIDTSKIQNWHRKHVKESFYKIGVTTKSVRSRICGSVWNDYETDIKYHLDHIYTDFECTLYDALWLEHKIKELNKNHKFIPAISFKGHQECFTGLTESTRQFFIDNKIRLVRRICG